MFLEVMELIKIILIDGIPCIVVEKGIFYSKVEEERNCSKTKFNLEPKRKNIPENFTKHQQSKEKNYYKKILDELKKKFRET